MYVKADVAPSVLLNEAPLAETSVLIVGVARLVAQQDGWRDRQGVVRAEGG